MMDEELLCSVIAQLILHSSFFILHSKGLFDLFPNFRKIGFHAIRVFLFDDFEKIFQLRPDIGYLSRGAWVEQDLLKEVIIFAQ